jgi:hypothetical protein
LIALKRGGKADPRNMKWQTISGGKEKRQKRNSYQYVLKG